MELWELVARESIRDIVARYNANGDSGRIDAMMALFSIQAILEVAGREPIVGREAIRDFFSAVATAGSKTAPLKSIQHHTTTHLIDIIDEKTAKGRSYFAVYTRDGLDHWGRYIDDYGRQQDQWLFLRRSVKVEGVTAGGWADSSGDWR
jgi:ketosteroid isomerase-like protein